MLPVVNIESALLGALHWPKRHRLARSALSFGLLGPWAPPRAHGATDACIDACRWWDATVACTQERKLSAMLSLRCGRTPALGVLDAPWPSPGDVLGRIENQNGRFEAMATAGGVAVVPDDGGDAP